MQTYIKTTSSAEFAAVRATRLAVLKTGAEIVKATKQLRQAAKIGSIPTLAIRNGKLQYL